jgi:hypothetical protein
MYPGTDDVAVKVAVRPKPEQLLIIWYPPNCAVTGVFPRGFIGSPWLPHAPPQGELPYTRAGGAASPALLGDVWAGGMYPGVYVVIVL